MRGPQSPRPGEKRSTARSSALWGMLCFALGIAVTSLFHFYSTVSASSMPTLLPHNLLPEWALTVDKSSTTQQWLAEEHIRIVAGTQVPLLNISEPFSLSSGVNIWDIFVPEVSCPDMLRIGNVGDG